MQKLKPFDLSELDEVAGLADNEKCPCPPRDCIVCGKPAQQCSNICADCSDDIPY